MVAPALLCLTWLSRANALSLRHRLLISVNFLTEEVSGPSHTSLCPWCRFDFSGAQSPACNSHPFMYWPCLIVLKLALEGKHSCSAPLTPLNLPDWSVSHTSLCSYLSHTSLCPCLSHTSLSPCLSHTSLCPCLSHTSLRPCLTPPCVRVSHLPVSVSVSHIPASMCISHTSLCLCLSHTPPYVYVYLTHLPVSVSHTSLCPCLTPPCARVSHHPGP